MESVSCAMAWQQKHIKAVKQMIRCMLINSQKPFLIYTGKGIVFGASTTTPGAPAENILSL